MGRRDTTKIIIELSGDDEHEVTSAIIEFAVKTMKSGKYDVQPHFVTGFTGELEDFETLRREITKNAIDAGVHVESDFDSVDELEVREAGWVRGKKKVPRKKSSKSDDDKLESILDNLFD